MVCSTEDILQLHCLAKDCVFCEKKNELKNKIKLEVCPYLYLVAHIMAGHVACWFEIIFLGNKQATANNWCCDLKLGKSCASNITQASDVRSSTILLEEQTRILRDCWLLLKRFNTRLALKTIDQGMVKVNQTKTRHPFSEVVLNASNHWDCCIVHLALKRWGSLLAFKAQLKCSVVPSHWLAEEPRWRINHASNFTACLPACLLVAGHYIILDKLHRWR